MDGPGPKEFLEQNGAPRTTFKLPNDSVRKPSASTARTSLDTTPVRGPPVEKNQNASPDMLSGLLLEDAILHNATKKIGDTPDKAYFLGLVAGIWVGFGGLAGLSAAGGIPSDVRASWPFLPKLLLGSFFAFALHLIILFGGQLFTGNCLILAIGFYNKVVPIRRLLLNWIIVYIGNWSGCLLAAYFLGYLTDLFEGEPYRSYLTSVTLSKLEEHGWGVIFLKAIPANAMVCLAVLLGIAARDGAGKIMGLWFPVVMFVLCGFEHCVANMFFTSIGLMYGAPTTIGRLWFNQSAAILGNFVGGAFVIGLSEHLMNHWRSPIFHQKDGQGSLAAHDVESTRRARDVREIHPADLVARVRALLHAEHHRTNSENCEKCDEIATPVSEGGLDSRLDLPQEAYQTQRLSLSEGHDEAYERRKAMRAQLGMKGLASWFHRKDKDTDDASKLA